MNPLRFCKFAIVGGSGVIVNTGGLWVLHSLCGVSLIPSSIIAIEASVLSNYILNSAWTFADHEITLQKLCKFHLVSLVPICANILLLVYFSNFVYYLYANMIGISAGLSWNYLANVCWTWKEKK